MSARITGCDFPSETHARWGHRGLVVSPHYLASEAGRGVLRRGGSAADAVIAAGTTLAVVYPHMCGIGGDAFVMVSAQESEVVECINASGWSSAEASINYLEGRGTSTMPEIGGPAVTVPGMVDGLRVLHDRYGRLPFAELLEDAIYFARVGFPVTTRMREWIAIGLSDLRRSAPLSRTFLRDGQSPQAGDVVVQPSLADSLELIGTLGARTLYEGTLADSIVAAVRGAGGVMNVQDLTEYRAEWVAPVHSTINDIAIDVLPPNSQGPVLQWMLEAVAGDSGTDPVARAGALLEAKQIAFERRDREIHDPRFKRSEATLVGDRAQTGRGGVSSRSGGDTAYLAAMDSSGTVVSMIHSLYGSFGSLVAAQDSGIILHNRGASFSADRHDPNSLEPRKRPLHTLMSAVVRNLRTGERAALGTMGGHGQPQFLAQILLGWLDGLSWEDAIRAPRWMHGISLNSDVPDTIRYESRLDPSVRGFLDGLGAHDNPKPWDQLMGHAHAISLTSAGSLGVVDPRSDGAVAAL